jgi:2,4-dienoyl-CoA reductase (NADPH2)
MHEKFKYKSKEELLARAAALGLELPFSDDITPLFTTSVIGKFNIENRLVVQPMEGYDSLADGSPSDLTRRRYLRYAAGGSGIIWYEAVAVSADGRSNPGQLWINNVSAGSFRLLNNQVRVSASDIAKNPLLIIQLTHSGRYSKPEKISRPMVAAPNSILDKSAPHILSDEELKRIQDDYVEAAKLSAEAGFDAIDIKACHGYLMIELLGAKNRTNSVYGGEPVENRFRFMFETIDRIMSEVPGILITTRLNLTDVYEGGFGVGSGKDPDFSDTISLIGKLREKGIRLVNASMGSPYHNPHVTRPYDTPLPGQQPPAEHPLEGVMKMINSTALFQEKFPDMQFVGSAYSWLRQFAPNTGAAVINKGWASYIGLGRSSFAYPDLPIDLVKKGKADPKRVCITCSGCTRLIRNFRPGGCVIRDREIYGTELKKLIADGK